MYQTASLSSADPIVEVLTIVGATAIIVSASVQRQEALSGRMRALTKEFRELLRNLTNTKECSFYRVDCRRLTSLCEQISLFKQRLDRCITGHILLYFALLIEVTTYFFVFVCSGRNDRPKGLEWYALAAVCMVSFLGVSLHFWEYLSSYKTTGLEVKDITAYREHINEKGLEDLLSNLGNS